MDKSLSAKHIVEEAMTKAFVRKCNKCQKPFLQEDGCNKMKCPCGNTQCYVCSANIEDYLHFDSVLGTCPMYGGKDQIKEEVAMAQEVTVQSLLRVRTELRDEDIRVDKKGKGTAILDPIDEVPLEALRITTPIFAMENPRPTTPPRREPPRRATTYPQVPPWPPTMYFKPRPQVDHTPPYQPHDAPPPTIFDHYHPPISPPLQLYDPPPIYGHIVGQPPYVYGDRYFPYPLYEPNYGEAAPPAAGPSKPTGNKLKKKSSMKVAEGSGSNRSATKTSRTVTRRSSVASFRSGSSGVSNQSSGKGLFGKRNSK
jgi:hypothetical protein